MRIRKVLTSRGDLDGTEYYYYNGHEHIEMRNGSEQTLRQYVRGTQYVDELVRLDVNGEPTVGDDCLAEVETSAEQTAQSNDDASYYYHQDANYNVVAVTDMNGDVVQRIDYSSYARPTFTDGEGRQRFGPTFGPSGNDLHTSAVAWQGLHLDLETHHSYNRARTLHHRLGRLQQRDPLGLWGGSGVQRQYWDGMNLYTYVTNNPTALIDPTGTLVVHWCKCYCNPRCSIPRHFWITLGRSGCPMAGTCCLAACTSACANPDWSSAEVGGEGEYVLCMIWYCS